jgi:LysM repeat protein
MHNTHTSSTPAAASSLRPRNRRLISGLSEAGDELSSTSPFDSRSASPIPNERLSRPGSSRGGVGSPAKRNPGTGSAATGSSDTLAGLWGNSWSALQGIASDLLGNDASTASKPRTRRPLSRIRAGRVTSTSAPPVAWGPTSAPGVQSVGVGSREEGTSALRAQKRKDMLLQTESSYADTLGRFKRRTSEDDRATMSAPPGENEDRDALVYLHHVQKSDTLAGITIRYNCSANALRKANRMWPNDTVQSRQAIVLPVDACSIKGRPISGPDAMGLLGDDVDSFSAGEAEEVLTPRAPTINGDAFAKNRSESMSTSTSNRRSSSAAVSSTDTEPPWHHDSWVVFPGASKPTEIVRLSRRNLGYFPPARRKSNCYSDLDTPSTSLDLTRTPAADLVNPALSPNRADPPQRPRRSRKLSNATNGYFPSYLAGPGGVGSMGKNVLSPGPAQDGLNKMFAKHLPDVAPPKNQQSLYAPEMPLYTGDGTPIASGTATPNYAPNLNAGMGIEGVGGAIEHWMRRVATKAKDATQPTDRSARAARASVGAPGRGAGGVGDLIEMTDEFEIGGDEDGEDERGRQGSDVYLGQSAAAIGGGSTSGWLGGATGTSTRQRERSHAKGGKDD